MKIKILAFLSFVGIGMAQTVPNVGDRIHDSLSAHGVTAAALQALKPVCTGMSAGVLTTVGCSGSGGGGADSLYVRFIADSTAKQVVHDSIVGHALGTIFNVTGTSDTVVKRNGASLVAPSVIAGGISIMDSATLFNFGTTGAGPRIRTRMARGTQASPADVNVGDSAFWTTPQVYSGGTYFNSGVGLSRVCGPFTTGQAPPGCAEIYTRAANGAMTRNAVFGPVRDSILKTTYFSDSAFFAANVGISTNTPAFRLQVNVPSEANGIAVVSSGGKRYVFAASSTGGKAYGTFNGLDGGDFRWSTDNNPATAPAFGIQGSANGTAGYITMGGKVSPAAPLELYTTVAEGLRFNGNVSGGAYINFKDSTSNVNRGRVAYGPNAFGGSRRGVFGIYGDSGVYVFANAADSVKFATNATLREYISPTGNHYFLNGTKTTANDTSRKVVTDTICFNRANCDIYLERSGGGILGIHAADAVYSGNIQASAGSFSNLSASGAFALTDQPNNDGIATFASISGGPELRNSTYQTAADSLGSYINSSVHTEITTDGCGTESSDTLVSIVAGDNVTLNIPALSCVSDVATFKLSGFPSDTWPTESSVTSPNFLVQDNGNYMVGYLTIQNDGTVTVNRTTLSLVTGFFTPTAVFTASGNKGISPVSWSYSRNTKIDPP